MQMLIIRQYLISLMTKENPLNQWKIPLYKIYTDDEDLDLITKIVKRGTQWALGPEIEEFENMIKDYVGCDYCLTLNSGTSALHSILLAYDIQPNDEIVVPSFTFISTANSVLLAGAKPVFADIEDKTFGLDPQKLIENISTSTKAIIPVDVGGLSCQINEIKKISGENNLLLIEDAAEALGASINGEKVGSISDTSMFSFCGNKVLTTGEGGAIVTNDKTIFEKIKLIRSHGRLDKGNYFDDPSLSNYLSLGYNWRMSSITATLGISQMQRLDKTIKKRKQNAVEISSKLSKCKSIIVPKIPEGYEHIFQMYTIRLPNKEIRDNLQKHLLKNKIFCKVYFKPIHQYSFYQNLDLSPKKILPKTLEIFDQVLTLPLYPNMTTEEKELLTSTVLEFFEET
jgi:perosamine synthetase